MSEINITNNSGQCILASGNGTVIASQNKTKSINIQIGNIDKFKLELQDLKDIFIQQKVEEDEIEYLETAIEYANQNKQRLVGRVFRTMDIKKIKVVAKQYQLTEIQDILKQI